MTSGLYESFTKTFIVDEEEDAVVPKDVKMRIGEAVEHCLGPFRPAEPWSP